MKYVFVSLKPSDSLANKIIKRCKRQKNFNKNIVAVTGTLLCYVVVLCIRQQEQAEEIKKLEAEIEELKKAEGE